MQEVQQYIYHCNHCGQLFESANQNPSICNLCGKDPLSPPFANNVAIIQDEPVSRSKTHGIPGKDEADFFSMNKKKKQKRWITFFAIWFLGLIGASILAYQYNTKNNQSTDQLTNTEKPNSEQIARKQKAVKDCFITFIKFATADTTQSKSAYILNGSELILDMNRHKLEKFSVNDIHRSKFVTFDLIETGEFPQASIRMIYLPITSNKLDVKEVTDLTNVSEIQKDADLKEITDSLKNEDNPVLTPSAEKQEEDLQEKKETLGFNSYSSFEFEVVFWLQNGEWKLDWPNYVRLCEANWNQFCKIKELDSPKKFRIYAREPIADSTVISGYTEYKFSEAINNNKTPSQLPQSVYVKNDSPEHEQIIEQFKISHQSPLATKKDPLVPLRYFDPSKSIRIDAILNHITINDEVVLVVEEINNFDWLTPPAKEN